MVGVWGHTWWEKRAVMWARVFVDFFSGSLPSVSLAANRLQPHVGCRIFPAHLRLGRPKSGTRFHCHKSNWKFQILAILLVARVISYLYLIPFLIPTSARFSKSAHSKSQIINQFDLGHWGLVLPLLSTTRLSSPWQLATNFADKLRPAWQYLVPPLK
jgi:hypothetical protein